MALVNLKKLKVTSQPRFKIKFCVNCNDSQSFILRKDVVEKTIEFFDYFPKYKFLPSDVCSRCGWVHSKKLIKNKALRLKVYSKDNFQCVYCGKRKVLLSLDHIKPESLGGLSIEENLLTACCSCNSKKSNRPVFEAPKYGRFL